MSIGKTYLNIIKAISEKSIANIIIFNNVKLKAFSLKSRTRQGYPPLAILFNILLARAIKNEK